MYSNLTRIGNESILDKLSLVYLVQIVNVDCADIIKSNNYLGFSYSYTANRNNAWMVSQPRRSFIHFRGLAYKLSFSLRFKFHILHLHPLPQTVTTDTDSTTTRTTVQNVSTNLPKPLLSLRSYCCTVGQNRRLLSFKARPQYPGQTIPYPPNLWHRQPSIRKTNRVYRVYGCPWTKGLTGQGFSTAAARSRGKEACRYGLYQRANRQYLPSYFEIGKQSRLNVSKTKCTDTPPCTSEVSP
jgi:hypothetical protein